MKILVQYVYRMYERNSYLEMQNKILENRCCRLEENNRFLHDLVNTLRK